MAAMTLDEAQRSQLTVWAPLSVLLQALGGCSLDVTRRLPDLSSCTAPGGCHVACVLLELVTATALTVGAELGRPPRAKFFLVVHSLTTTHPRPAALLFEEMGGIRPPEVQPMARFTLHSLCSC